MTGIENVYTRHEPLIAKVLDAVTKGTLNENHYPSIGSMKVGQKSAVYGADERGRKASSQATGRVVVWVLGGTTYEEAAHVQLMNSSGNSIILGGSCVHNSSSFLRELAVAPI